MMITISVDFVYVDYVFVCYVVLCLKPLADLYLFVSLVYCCSLIIAVIFYVLFG